MEALLANINQLNWWAILVAVLSTMPVGYVWYDLKMGFGKPWSRMVGLTEKDLQNPDGMAKTFGVMLFVSLLTAVFIALLLRQLSISGLYDSLLFGIIVGAVLRGGAHFVHNGFARKSDQLTWIDVGHDLISITVMTMIIGVWV